MVYVLFQSQYSFLTANGKNKYFLLAKYINCNLIAIKLKFSIKLLHKRIFACMTPAEINLKWNALQQRIADDFDNEKPDLKVMLFLIGVQELGQGPRKFSKRQKEELMHIATCKLFSAMGFYELEGLDQDGWPHWKRVGVIPNYTMLEQEMVLKSLIINYFDEM